MTDDILSQNLLPVDETPNLIQEDTDVDERNKLHPLGYKIFLDRYAHKDGTKQSLAEGDTVIICTNTETGHREVGTILVYDRESKKVKVKLIDTEEVIERHVDQIDKPLETRPSEMLDRVARGIAAVEKTPELRVQGEEKFRWALDGWKFIPAGRILTAAGTDQQLTYYNCYVIPHPQDSRAGIFKTLSDMTELFSRGAGVGIPLSTLRPKFAYVKGVNGRSSGAVSWGSVYSFVTGLVEQGGSRRGALMLILEDWHPDILDFIDSKTKAGSITNANISVGISDRFMQAVENDEDWILEFPDTSYEKYDEEWDGNIELWKSEGKPTIEYKRIKARQMWDKIIKSAWTSAEPGIWFRDRSNNLSNSWYYERLICTNPCGEQPLPKWSVCNLGAVNLSRFVKNNEVNWENLKTTIHYGIRFLDNAIDATPYFFEENQKQQTKERRVGLNTMGLAEMMIKLGIRYGSQKSLDFIDKLYEFIVRESYAASAELAQEKGKFPKFDKSKYLMSGFVKNLPPDIQETIAQKGMRNVTVLTQAPNGTIGTMAGTSTGIEPFYSWSYFTKTRIGIHEENVAVVDEWKEQHPGQDLPDYFVNAMDLTPEEHVRVQAAIQKWIDSAISKTCNVPTEYTVEQTAALYTMMYKLGCKGGTIYRDKSRDEQVLMQKDDVRAHELLQKIREDNASQAEGVAEPAVTDTNWQTQNQLPIEQPKLRPHPAKRVGVTISKSTPIGTAHIVMNNDENGRPLEVFVEVGKAGSDTAAMTEALGRIMSLVLRMNSPLEPIERVEEMIGQMKGIGGARSVGFGKNRVSSLPDAIAQALDEEYNSADFSENLSTDEAQVAENSDQEQLHLNGSTSRFKTMIADLCPSCGKANFVRSEACKTCTACGHSEC